MTTKNNHKKGITPKMRRFMDAYLKEPNGRKAAIKAGYPKKSAAHCASRILQSPQVKRELKRRYEAASKKADVSVERILKEYEKLAFSNVLHYVRIEGGEPVLDLSDLPEEYAAAISECEMKVDQDGNATSKIKLVDKKGALQDLGRYHAMFTDKVQVDDSLAKRLAEARKRKAKAK